MSVAAAVTQYREEFVAAFEVGQSNLRLCTTTEAQIKGNTCTFLVAGTGGAEAVTRGQNGLIPARQPVNTQLACTLREWHDLQQMTDFDIFASQSDQRRIMQDGGVKVINRKIDKDIIAQLDTATIDTGTAGPATVALVMRALAYLGDTGEVPIDEEDNMFAVVTHSFYVELMQTPEFASSDYVEVKPFNGPARRMRRWAGVNWITSSLLTGTGTAEEKCYMFHRSAIGNAMDTRGLDVKIGYDGEQHYSWARVSGYFGSKLLQNSGVVCMKHDGTKYALS